LLFVTVTKRLPRPVATNLKMWPVYVIEAGKEGEEAVLILKIM